MAARAPIATREVRWFFEGPSSRHESLRRWFETSEPVAKIGAPGAPAWRGRLGGAPDVYLLVPGADDLGVKWREGELQLKGRIASLGAQRFGARHEGRVERWVKWSYAGLPAAYRELFATAGSRGLAAASVKKTRALRKLRLDVPGAGVCEVDADARVQPSISVELVDLELAGKAYCSLAFEAFPDDSRMDEAFTRAVQVFLAGLEHPELRAAQSLSHPAWLQSISR
jgi:hypothetical protein